MRTNPITKCSKSLRDFVAGSLASFARRASIFILATAWVSESKVATAQIFQNTGTETCTFQIWGPCIAQVPPRYVTLGAGGSADGCAITGANCGVACYAYGGTYYLAGPCGVVATFDLGLNEVPSGTSVVTVDGCCGPTICEECGGPPQCGGSAGGGASGGPPGGDGGGGGDSGYGGDEGGCTPEGCGMPVWSVAEPNISIWLRDEPLGYQPARGPRLSLQLSYHQRETMAGNIKEFFGVGKKWNFGWLSCVYRAGNRNFSVLFPGGGRRNFATTNDYLSNSRFSGNAASGFSIDYPDGSKLVYGFLVTNQFGLFAQAFLTEQWNRRGQKTTFFYASYNPSAPVVRLSAVVDGDGRTNRLYYNATNAFSDNLISHVVDAFGRTNFYAYDTNGYLTNITDVAGISTSLAYDQNGVITNMTTPYGGTRFKVTDTASGASSPNGRSVLVTQPDGGHQLYLYTNGAPGVASSYSSGSVPDVSVFSSTLDNSHLDQRNSFHWGARQYGNLSSTNIGSFTSSDFKKARMKHWLLSNTNLIGTNMVGSTISLKREPSPDAAGSIEGQMTWYDYFGKTNAQHEGTQFLPWIVAKVLPDLSTRYHVIYRNSFGAQATNISTFSVGGSILLRTNFSAYASGDIDVVTFTNAIGVQAQSNSYNSFHEVLTNFDALGQQTVYTYNSDHQVSSVTRPTGLITTNIYGADGQLSTTYDYAIVGGSPVFYRTNSYTYAADLIYTHTDERGSVTTNLYDNLNRLTNSSDSRGAMQYQYINLDLVKVTDRMGFTNCFGYDSMRRKVAETNALGFYTLYDYCNCGSLNSTRDAEGNFTYFFYNNAGRRVNTVYPDGYSVTNILDLLGRPANVVDSANFSVTNWFNNQGLRYAISTAAGNREYMDFDALDRATNTIDSSGVSVASTFDNLNRVLARKYADNGLEHFGYSAAGMIAYTNQIGLSNFFAYDPLRRKTFETNANYEILSYTYSPASDLLTLTDGKSQTTSWHYDEFGRVTNKLDQASTEILRYKYDADNRLTNRWSLEKGNTGYAYDPVGNLTSIHYPISSSVSFGYDALNRRTNMVDAIGTTKYTYTPAGQMAIEDGPFDCDTVTSSYSNRLRTSLSLQQPSGVWTNGFGWDAIERLTNVTSVAGSFGYKYESGFPSHLVARLSLPNDSFITNQFDVEARLQSTVLKKNAGGLIDSYSYMYNAANQRTNLVRGDFSNVGFLYDKIGQLTVADSSDDAEDRGYTYDAAWNLNYRTNNGTPEAFSVNSLNELASGPGGSFYYDSNGNLTNDSARVFIYDDENRLIDVSQGSPFSGAWRSTFGYDGLGRLRLRTEYIGDGSSWNPVSTNLNIYDGMRVIQERDGNNTPNVSYTRGNDLSGSLEGAGGIGGLLARSSGYSCADSSLTIRVTNDTAYCLYALQIWDDYNTYVTDGYIDPGGVGEYSIAGVPGRTYHAFAYSCDYYFIQVFNDSFTASLNTHSVHFVGGEGDEAFDTGNPLCGDPGTWPRHDYYFADGNGNIVTVVDTNQTVSAAYRYDPFGNNISQGGPMADANVYRFSSKEFHTASGMYYYGYRFYDPNLQRWAQRDPLSDQPAAVAFFQDAAPRRHRNLSGASPSEPFESWDGQNLFAFVRNEPVGHQDPLGLADIYWPPKVAGNCNSDDISRCRVACAARGLVLKACNVKTDWFLLESIETPNGFYERWLWTRNVSCDCTDPRSCPPPWTGGGGRNAPPPPPYQPPFWPPKSLPPGRWLNN